MNASIMPAYHKFLTPTTKVDYVLSIKPAADSAAADEAISNLQRTANGSANHTAFGPLCHNPISVSIETKRHGGDARKADVQLATWQAAQWTFFRSRASAEAIRRLEFLPGVVVQGHEWKFTATTWEDGKTVSDDVEVGMRFNMLTNDRRFGPVISLAVLLLRLVFCRLWPG